MLNVLLSGTLNSVLSEVIVIFAIALVLFIIFKIGKAILKLIFGLIINSILGIVAIFALNYIFNLGLPLNAPILIATAIFGLPAVGTILILKLTGAAFLFLI